MTIDDLHIKIDLRQAMQEEHKATGEFLDVLTKEIKEGLKALEYPRAETLKWVAEISTSVRESVDKTKLLELGVPAATIIAATKQTQVESLRVSPRKEGE